MPYNKTKDGSLVNEVTLGDGYPLSNDLQPLKIGGEASILGISSPLPDGSDSGLFRVDGDLDITGTLKTKLSHDLIYDFDDEVNTLAQAKVDALIDSAPAALDTLNELAAALGDDASFATTVTNSIATKVGLTGNETIAGVKTFSSAVTIHTATDAILNFKSSDDSWSYMQFLQNDGDRIAYIGTDGDQDRLILNATENGANEIEINTTTVDMNANLDVSGTFKLGGHAMGDIDIGSEFVDTDDHLMSSGAIKEKIEDYGYTTNTGDVTLSGAQTFTGQKNFNTSFPQVQFTDDSHTDKVQVGLSGNVFINRASDTDINFHWRDNSNNELFNIDTGAKTVTIGESNQTTYNLKIGDNGRMNMPQRGLEFENAHGYFSPLGDMMLPLFINTSQTDLIRFQSPLTFEYYDYSASAYVDDMSNVGNLQKLLDGRRSTAHSLTNTKRKFRFVITRGSSWADDHLFYIENTWSSIGTWASSASGGGSLTPTMVVERLDGSFDASDDSNNDWTTNSGITTDWHTTGIWNGFGLAMYYSTGMHNAETHIRITVTFPEYADASKTIGLKNIGIISSYSSAATNKEAFVQDFNRNATGYGDVNIPTGHTYKINAATVISNNGLGSGIINSSLTSVGTLGSLTVSGDATFDTTTLKVDSSNNRVGIGTASPNADLQIHSASGTKLWITAGGSNPADAAAIRLSEQENGSSNYFEIDYNGSSNILAFHSNNQNDMFSMYRNGNTVYTGDATKFGVGTSSLQNKFQIYHTAADGDDGMMIVRDDTSTADTNLLGGIGFDSTDGNVPSSVLESSAFIAAYAAEDQGTGDKGADLVFGATLINDDDDTVSHEYMRILDSGNVGIGTTSPSTELEVDGTITATSIDAGTIYNTSLAIGRDSTDQIDFSSDNQIRFKVGNANEIILNVNSLYPAVNDGTALGGTSNNYSDLYLASGGTINWNNGDIVATHSSNALGITGGKVGIGIEAPTTTLDVEGTVSYKHISLTADSDDLDVSDCTVVECTPSGTDRLGGLTGGVQGQVIHVLKVDSGFGRLIIEHNEGTGNQDIFLSGGSDVTLTSRGGMTLYCNGTSWFALDK